MVHIQAGMVRIRGGDGTDSGRGWYGFGLGWYGFGGWYRFGGPEKSAVAEYRRITVGFRRDRRITVELPSDYRRIAVGLPSDKVGNCQMPVIRRGLTFCDESIGSTSTYMQASQLF